MLTPRFELSQDAEFITLVVRAPYTNVAQAEFHTEDHQVIFHCSPYYLRLHLPGRVLDDDRNSATYDADTGTYTAHIAKETRGEVFPDLDMLTKLLTPPDPSWQTQLKPCLVQEIDPTDTVKGPSDAVNGPSDAVAVSGPPDTVKGPSDAVAFSGPSDAVIVSEAARVEGDEIAEQFAQEELDEDIDWFVDQVQSLDTDTDTPLLSAAKYGFAQKKSGFSQKLMLEFSDIFDVKDPDSLTSSTKSQERQTQEKESFNEDHYLADLFDNSEIFDMLTFQPWWQDLSGGCTLTPEAKEKLLQLPKKSYLLDAGETNSVYLGLVDIVFAYAYNHRVLRGENNVESGWTIAKIASTLSWLECFGSLRDVVVACFRRALTFPLFRNWDLCVKVLEDVRTLFAGGKKALLKCLLDVHDCMIMSEPRFVFNDLYITDYCVWLQGARSKHVQSMAGALQAVQPTKADVDLDLPELEMAAMLVMQEQGGGGGGLDEVTQRFGKVTVSQGDSDDDDESDEDDDDDSDEEEEEDSEEDEETDDDSEDDEDVSDNEDGHNAKDSDDKAAAYNAKDDGDTKVDNENGVENGRPKDNDDISKDCDDGAKADGECHIEDRGGENLKVGLITEISDTPIDNDSGE